MIKQLQKVLLLLCALIVGGSAWAEDFTLSSASSVTQNGITVSFAKGSGSTAPTWYSAGLRLYGSNTITISSTNTITGITFNWEKQGNKAFASATANAGSYTHPSAAGEGTWSGSASEVVFTLGSSGQLQLNTFSVTVSSGSSTPTCATPTFSPAAGAVVSGTTVTISSATDGATIYYTTDGTTPSSSSSVYSEPIEITTATTIKAFASKSDYDDSEVATAAYTIKQLVSGYTIDFENDVEDYVDWEFSNVGNTNTAITAHGGSKYGANINSSGNGTVSCTITTKSKVNPGTITFYVSKCSNNTTESSWFVEVSEDKSDWTQVDEESAQSMSKGTWDEASCDLSAYSNVYVRVSYGSSSAIRAIDDITLEILTTATISINSACTDGAGKYYGTYSNNKAFVVPADLTVSEISVIGSELYIEPYAIGDIVPANTGVMISSTTSGDHTVALTTEAGSSVLDEDNMLKASSVAMTQSDTKFYRLTMHNGTDIGFWWGAADGAAFDIAANKAYLAVPTSALAAARQGFSLFGEDEVNGIDNPQLSTLNSQPTYTLSGQRVEKAKKGLYIVNGKKCVIR